VVWSGSGAPRKKHRRGNASILEDPIAQVHSHRSTHIDSLLPPVKAVRIHRFGPPEVVVIDDVPIPSPREGELLVRAAAAGVGPWDAIIREGRSKVSPQPPLARFRPGGFC